MSIPKYYREVAEKYDCIFYNAAEDIYPSEVDSLHLTEEVHKVLSERLYEIINQEEATDLMRRRLT